MPVETMAIQDQLAKIAGKNNVMDFLASLLTSTSWMV